MESFDAVAIGGGAAGIFCAIACARSTPKPRFLVLEAGSHCLSKVLISGGGRCNVTHACFDPALLAQHYPRGGKALRGPFSRFQPQDTVEWFAAEGVRLKTEPDGRMFPVSDRAETIARCLVQAAERSGVEIRIRSPVCSLEKRPPHSTDGDGSFGIVLKSGDRIQTKRVAIATGSNPQGYRWATALGHAVVPPVPSLFTLTVRDRRLEGLAGIAVPWARLLLLPGSPQSSPADGGGRIAL